jgi:peptide/nickel transport system permease protein
MKYFYFLFIIICIVFFADIIYTVSPYDLNPTQILQPPSTNHIFGTDRLGRDIFARILQGGKTSLIIGFLSASITSLIGLFIGINSGYFKGKIDKTITIVIDLFLTFPTFFLLLALVSYVDASVFVLIFVLSITSWMGMARLIRSESFAISNKPYIKILKLANVSWIKIIFKYYTPLIAPIFLVSFIFGVGGAILGESALSFLGLGINPPQMSWGSILSDGKEVMDIAWWISFFAGLFIFLVTFCLMQISDYLQHKINTKNIVISNNKH